MEATQKQINYAKQLGIETPENFTKEALSKLIEQKSSGSKPKASEQQVQTVQHNVVIQRTEKPHSYEFGRATSRHKVYYANIDDLKEQYKALKESGFIEEQEIETIKI